MADENVKKAAEKIAVDTAEGTGIVLLVVTLLQKFGQGVVIAVVENAAEQIKKALEDNRAELVRDLVMLPKNGNINQWYDEAKANFTEARFVTLLCKLPKDKDGSRTYILEKLDTLDKAGFDRVLSQLEHDNVMQFVQRAANYAKRMIGKDITFTKDSFRGIGEFFSNAAPHVDNAAASAIRGLANLLGGRR